MLKVLAKKFLGEQFLGMLDCHRFPALKQSWGGPFNGQEFRTRIFLELVQKIGFSAIVETGAYRGTTTDYLHKATRLPVYSVESNGRSYGYLRRRVTSRLARDVDVSCWPKQMIWLRS